MNNKVVSFEDPKTGYTVRQLTSTGGSSYKYYFSAESWLPDDRSIVFYRTEEGKQFVTKVDEQTGETADLTDGDGWSVGSFSLDRVSSNGYIMKDHILFRINASTGEKTEVAALPEGVRPSGHLTVSKSGLVGGAFREKGGISALIVADPKTGKSETVFRSDYLLGHSQLCPGDDQTIFFVHETGGDALQRMWLFDMQTKKERPYFVEREGDWITHETWSYDGRYMYFIKWPHAIYRGSADGYFFEEIFQGDFHHPGPSRNGRWIAADTLTQGVILLLDTQTGSSKAVASGLHPRDGSEHCHPSFNRRGDRILFTRPHDGRCDIAVVDVGCDTGGK